MEERKITLEAVTPRTVSNYLGFAVRQFREPHNRAAPCWASIPMAGIRGLLLVQKRSPLAIPYYAPFVLTPRAPCGNNKQVDTETEGGPEEVSPQQTHLDEQPMLYCPVCSERLAQSRCKLVCPRCGYFMSCADYY